MPKHVPTFKHLIATSAAPEKKERKQISLNERLERSRAEARRRAADEAERQARAQESDVPAHVGPDLGESSSIHPAELLRRQRASQRQAARGVAGPAPPPSWRSASIQPDLTTPSYGNHEVFRCRSFSLATQHDLYESARLLTIRPERDELQGPPRLTKLCTFRILRGLGNDAIAIVDMAQDGQTETTWTMADILREQLRYMATALLTYILGIAGYQAEGSPYRFHDGNLLHLLHAISTDGAIDDEATPVDQLEDQDDEWGDDWDTPEMANTALQHLPLTLHSFPHTLMTKLRVPPTLNHSRAMISSALTSLNLAYSTLPTDLDKLVNVLPSGLRELSLVGVRFRGGTVRKAELSRGFAALGRKLIVLTTLDMSFFPVPLDRDCLQSLLVPPTHRLPSLGLFGYRMTSSVDDRSHIASSRIAQTSKNESDSSKHEVQPDLFELDMRSILASVLRSKQRKYVEIRV